MSASEKLERLKAAMDDWGPEALADALPEIIAVVEAAGGVLESADQEPFDRLEAALAALDEKLP